MTRIITFRTILAITILLAMAQTSYAAKSSAKAKLEDSGVDNRIKTLIYSDSEVYQVVARTGFQSQIEFGANENIETISLGDPIGWQVTPAGRRIFLKPLHKTGITNLSVITNKRSYQFELISTDSGSRSSNHAYLIRFYYPESSNITMIEPDDRTRNSLRPVSNTPIPILPSPRVAPQQPRSFSPAAIPNEPVNQSFNIFNFNYTLTGPDDIAPKKIYDDGKITYFEFPKNVESPRISVINPDGSEAELEPIIQDGPYNKIVSVNRIAGKFNVTSGKKSVQIFNEQILSLAPLNSATTSKN